VEVTCSVPAPTPVSLGIYDASGRLVRMLLERTVVETGERRLTWDGRGANGRPVASFIHFYRLKVGDRGLESKLHVSR
jgi:hypothetical protein